MCREGLYYRFFCTCKLPDKSICRIIVSDGENRKDLGICVPSGDRFTLTARVPVKYLPGESLRFTLKPQERVIPVAADKPFSHLEELDRARFRMNDGKGEILIDSTPGQQDSDQNREFLHK